MPNSPSRRGRKYVAPTSGKKPINVSGIAKMVFSVAIRKGVLILNPTPPPTYVRTEETGIYL